MKVKVTAELVYYIATEAGVLYDLRKVEEWKGFLLLKNKEGEVILNPHRASGSFSESFSKLFSPGTDDSFEATLLRGTPSLINLLEGKP